jgi:hypothetical protein
MSHSIRESIRALCLLTIIVSAIVGILVWVTPDRPDEVSWPWRIGTVAAGCIALLTFAAMYLPKGKSPDLLRTFYGPYFECKGFCFVLCMHNHKGVCELEVAFQNRHSQPCTSRIVLRPSRKFFRSQKPEAVTLEIACPGGGFGRKILPLPVDAEAQGTNENMDIIAGVQYLNGRGETLHYGVADVTLENRVSFDTPFMTALSVVSLLGGMIVTHKHASVKIAFPKAVECDLPKEAIVIDEIFWKYGDPPINESVVRSRYGARL